MKDGKFKNIKSVRDGISQALKKARTYCSYLKYVDSLADRKAWHLSFTLDEILQETERNIRQRINAEFGLEDVVLETIKENWSGAGPYRIGFSPWFDSEATDETELEAETPEELAELFRGFCKENGTDADRAVRYAEKTEWEDRDDYSKSKV